MPKPVFLLVPGAWHSSDYYGKVIASLKAHGYEYATVTLPSVGASTYDFTEDATAIREGASELVEEGHDVVVVAHSYSGLPTGQLPQSLSKAEREKNDLKGGIIRLVFIVAYMVPEGFQAAPRDDITTLFAFMEPDTETGLVHVSPDDAKRLWYHDVPREEAEEVASTLKPQSIGVFWSVTTTAAWRYIPSAYVLCKNDRAFPKQLAEILLKGAKSMGPNMVDIVEECESGHFPMLSKPDWVVDFLLRVVGEKGEKV